MDIDQDELLYAMLEDIYNKQMGDNELPVGWYSLDVQKRIEILDSALKNNKKAIDTSGYYDAMEKVITSSEEINKR